MKRLIVTIVVFWIGLCGMAAPLAAAGNADVFSLRGHRRSAVILPAADSTDHAATLAKYLKAIVGHDVALVTNPANVPPPAGALKIHVGRDAYVQSLKLDFDRLHPYGYYLKLTDGDNLVIAGKYRGGTDYAVFDFLKRYGGYRSFMPGDLGEVIPHHPVITLPSDLNLRENPSFMTLASGGGGVGGFTRAWRLTLQATHNLDEIYPPSKYMATHPEYYGMMDGKREKAGPDDAWQPCVSNPDLPAIAVDYARRSSRTSALPWACRWGSTTAAATVSARTAWHGGRSTATSTSFSPTPWHASSRRISPTSMLASSPMGRPDRCLTTSRLSPTSMWR